MNKKNIEEIVDLLKMPRYLIESILIAEYKINFI